MVWTQCRLALRTRRRRFSQRRSRDIAESKRSPLPASGRAFSSIASELSTPTCGGTGPLVQLGCQLSCSTPEVDHFSPGTGSTSASRSKNGLERCAENFAYWSGSTCPRHGLLLHRFSGVRSLATIQARIFTARDTTSAT